MAQYRGRKSKTLVDAEQFTGAAIEGFCDCAETSAALRAQEQALEDAMAEREKRQPVTVADGPRKHFHRPAGSDTEVARLSDGDWIVRNRLGQLNFCSAASFAENYEPVE